MCSTESITVDPPSSSGGAESSPTTVGKLSDPNNNHQRNPNRRSNKPIMEKRRRARINNCLNELKGILLEAMRKDPARHSKLEKADILELTVSHLKSLHGADCRAAQTVVTSPNPAELLARYRAGFTECATEVSRFLSSPKADGIDPASTARLMAHLNECLSKVSGSPRSPSLSPTGTVPIPKLSNVSSVSGDGTQNLTTTHASTPIISLVPSRLPSGEIAFVVPGFSSIRNGIQIQTGNPASYQPLLSPEVPLELTVSSAHAHNFHTAHHHAGSTSSPSSSTSSLSPAYSYAPIAHAHHSSFYISHSTQHHSSQSSLLNYSQQPLALVTPKRDMVDLSCWRPW